MGRSKIPLRRRAVLPGGEAGVDSKDAARVAPSFPSVCRSPVKQPPPGQAQLRQFLGASSVDPSGACAVVDVLASEMF